MRFELPDGLPYGWTYRLLATVCSRITSGGTPSRRVKEYFGGNVNWVKTQELLDRKLVDTEEKITVSGLNNSSAKLLPENTVLLAMYGATVGKLGILEKESTCNQACCAFICDPKQSDYRFLFYVLLGNRTNIIGLASGAAQQNLSGQQLKLVELAFPPLALQKNIANVLASIDDRIDHNRVLAANLEAIARQLFKSWFVDFDPVRAKAAGEKPSGLADDIAILFPDRFVESELGEIPEGWSTAHLADLIHAERGLSYKGAGLADRESGKSMHNLNSVLEGGGYKYAGIKFYTGAFKERHIAKAGDIIVANTEQGHKHRLIGFPAIIPTSCDEGLFSHHLYRVRLLRGAATTRYWLYYALMAPDVREQIIGHANGSTVNMLKPTGLQVPLVVLPLLRLCQQFDDIVKALHELIEASIAESAVLTNLRDLLLPRLISGKLRVEDAVSLVEETIA